MEKCINICIVHYNTPHLTECLIKSINKFTPNCNIYIFDNSDKYPFIYKLDNIILFDNTKGQIINFDSWLDSIIDKEDSWNNWVSAKHCYSILKCIELINQPFILLDSDVLLKQDISSLVSDLFICSGDIERYKRRIPRIAPYLCYINTPLCLSKNIKFFDVNRIVHISHLKIWYDTGASFLEDISISGAPFNYIKHTDYITHYGSASWENPYHPQLSPEEWLKQNEQYYL